MKFKYYLFYKKTYSPYFSDDGEYHLGDPITELTNEVITNNFMTGLSNKIGINIYFDKNIKIIFTPFYILLDFLIFIPLEKDFFEYVNMYPSYYFTNSRVNAGIGMNLLFKLGKKIKLNNLLL